VQGRQVSISPLIILIALLFWGWVWGVAGAFLAVPMTTAILILSARIAPLRPLALLLSDETDEEGLDEVTTLRE
jgi:AI-2 transport protein TqsA